MAYFPYSFWSSSNLKNGLIAFYTFNNSSDIGNDNFTNSYDLTANGTINSVAGKVGNAVYNGATSSYMEVADPTNVFNLTADRTFSFWFKTDDLLATNIFLVGKFTSDVGNDYTIYINASQLWFQLETDAGQEFLTHDLILSANTWYFVVVTHVLLNKELRIRFNNLQEQIINYNGNIIHNNNRAFRGLEANQGTNYTIDNLGIWNRVLTPQEAITLYNGGNGYSLFS